MAPRLALPRGMDHDECSWLSLQERFESSHGIPTVAVRGEGQQRPRCVDRGPGVELSFIAESLNRY